MRVHVVHAHPVETSYNRALFNAAVEALTAAGHTVDPLNLYDEAFQAVMSREERLNYHEVPDNLTPEIAPYVERLRAADAIVFVHPVWNYGYPGDPQRLLRPHLPARRELHPRRRRRQQRQGHARAEHEEHQDASPTSRPMAAIACAR